MDGSGVDGETDRTAGRPDEAEKDAKVMAKIEESFARIGARYVGRAEHLFSLPLSLADLYDNRAELGAMNHKKRGPPFKYATGLMYAIATLRSAFGLDLRTCEGMAKVFLRGREYPGYSQISRRINGLGLSVRDSLSEAGSGNMKMELIPDGTGLTPATRSEYIRARHKARRGFLRLVIAMNRDTPETASFSLTDERTGETRVAEEVIEDALRNIGIDPEERRRQVRAQKNRKHKTYRPPVMTADGGFGSRRVFSFCKKLGITPNIRVQTNSNARADGTDRARAEVVPEQLGGPGAAPRELAAMADAEREENRKEWKRRAGYSASDMFFQSKH